MDLRIRRGNDSFFDRRQNAVANPMRVLQRIRKVQVADLFDRPTDLIMQEVQNLFAKSGIFEN